MDYHGLHCKIKIIINCSKSALTLKSALNPDGDTNWLPQESRKDATKGRLTVLVLSQSELMLH